MRIHWFSQDLYTSRFRKHTENITPLIHDLSQRLPSKLLFVSATLINNWPRSTMTLQLHATSKPLQPSQEHKHLHLCIRSFANTELWCCFLERLMLMLPVVFYFVKIICNLLQTQCLNKVYLCEYFSHVLQQVYFTRAMVRTFSFPSSPLSSAASWVSIGVMWYWQQTCF